MKKLIITVGLLLVAANAYAGFYCYERGGKVYCEETGSSRVNLW